MLLFGCAQPGKLTGGDKDETPPRILGSSPQNGAVNFDGTSIRMEFDEYVDIGGAAKALVVTPPFDQAPTFTLHNKEVTIEWEGELLDSTTYVFNFGEGIADVNERNPLDSNLFVFSTGSYIDSFEVHGRVVDAFTLQPVKDVTVMLYDNNIDSLPLTSLPPYFAKSDDQGKYAIGYLAAGKYEVFALETGNNGYTFDLPIERIAYRNETDHGRFSRSIRYRRSRGRPVALPPCRYDSIPQGEETSGRQRPPVRFQLAGPCVYAIDGAERQGHEPMARTMER